MLSICFEGPLQWLINAACFCEHKQSRAAEYVNLNLLYKGLKTSANFMAGINHHDWCIPDSCTR